MITAAVSLMMVTSLSQVISSQPWQVTLAKFSRAAVSQGFHCRQTQPMTRVADPLDHLVLLPGQDLETVLRMQAASREHSAAIQDLLKRGREYREEGELTKARAVLEQAMVMEGSAYAAVQLADVMTRQGDLDQVLGMLSPWMEGEDPTEGILLYASLSAAHRKIVMPGQAEFSFAKVLDGRAEDFVYQSMLPSSRQPWAVEYACALAITRLVSNDNVNIALFYSRKAASLWSQDALANYALSHIYRRRGQLPELKQALTQVARFGKGHIREEALQRLQSLP